MELTLLPGPISSFSLNQALSAELDSRILDAIAFSQAEDFPSLWKSLFSLEDYETLEEFLVTVRAFRAQ